MECLFYLKNRVLSKSDHVCGSESWHEQRRSPRTSEKELLLLIRLENVTKPSLKSLDFRQIVYKWRKFKTTVTLPRSSPPTKITLKARRVIVHEVAKDLRVNSKQLKAFLTLADVNIHESTIRRTLEKESRRKPLLM